MNGPSVKEKKPHADANRRTRNDPTRTVRRVQSTTGTSLANPLCILTPVLTNERRRLRIV